MRNRTRILAVAILGVAVALRFWRLHWGLGDIPAFFCEELVFSGPAAGWVPLSWRSLRVPNLLYPPLYAYLAGATTALAHLVGLQTFTHTFSLQTLYTARVPSALAGIASVWLVGRLAARMYPNGEGHGSRVGLTAAAFLAVAPFHVMESHRSGADILLSFTVAVTMVAAWRLMERPSAVRALLAGMAAGLAFGAKQNGLAMVVPVAWACAEVAYERRSFRLLVAYGALAIAGLVLAWIAACPPCVLRFHDFLFEIATHRQKMSSGQGVTNHLVPSLGWLGYPYVYELGASLPYALGWPLDLAAMVGAAIALRRRERADRLIGATILPYFLIIGAAAVTFPRYLLPLFPGLTILAARAVWALGGRFPRSRGVALGFVLCYTLVLTITQVARFSVEQRRELAAWTREAVLAARPPSQARAPIRVGMPMLMASLDYYRIANPIALAKMKAIEQLDGHWFDETYDAFIVPHWVTIFVRRDRDVPGLARDLAALESGEAGYVLGKRFSSWFLQRDFYTWLDPAFHGDLWQGDTGYDVYLRAPPSPAPSDAPSPHSG